jgi:(2Fe-2S) ferredoxin
MVKLTMAHCGRGGDEGPVLVVYPEGTWYSGLTLMDVPRFIDEQLIAGRPLADQLLRA